MSEPIPPIVHVCALHQDREKAIDQIVTRVQQLVTEWHGSNITGAAMQGQINVLTARVPADLPQQLTTLALKHDALHKDFMLLRGQMYSIIGAVILSGVGAFVAWALRGGMK